MSIVRPTEFSNNSVAGLLTVGLFSDLHYDPVTGAYLGRNPTQGRTKLAAVLAQFNAFNLDLIVNCGDFIDGSSSPANALSALQTIWGDLQTASCQTFRHVHGNHDVYQLTKSQLISTLGMPASYYSEDRNGFHCIFLDAENYRNDDVSDYPYPAGQGFSGSDSYINPAQRTWLAADLAATNLPVIIFCHAPLFVQAAQPTLVLSNRAEIFPIIANKNVVAWINGHAHTNGLDISQTVGGIPCITLMAVADGDYSTAPATSYACSVITFNPINKAVQVVGFGAQRACSLGRR